MDITGASGMDDFLMGFGLYICMHSFFRPVREDQTVGFQGKTHWKEEEDHCEKCQPQPVLQRVFRLHGGTK